MSRFRFQGRDTIKKTTLVLGMLPGFMGMTAVYIIMTQLGLIDKLESLIFFYAATTPVNYMVQKGYFDSIPNTLFEPRGWTAPPIWRSLRKSPCP